MLPVESTNPSVFLSHTASDKGFARRLAGDLLVAGARVWIDEAEIAIGDSLILRISEGIYRMDYLAIILSPGSVRSEWVQRELDVALNREIQGRKVKVLPLLLEKCEIPAFLIGKKYADFTDPERYVVSLNEVIERLGLPEKAWAQAYEAYPFLNGPRRFRDLPDDAKQLLRQIASANPQLIAVDWQETVPPRRLRGLKIGTHDIDIGDSDEHEKQWRNLLQTLERRWLIQAVGSRPGYTAYKITPDGWDLVKFLGTSTG